MGEVFVAVCTAAGGSRTPVALKRILPALSTRQDARPLLVDEARLSCFMTHRNLVPALDIAPAATEGFFTMPYVEGDNLLSLLRIAARCGQPLGDDTALAIVQGVATGLHYAHEITGNGGRPMGIVHCDVSPSNVIITPTGEVKLIDWGIARGQHVTRGLPEMARGTLGYSSPEHTHGRRVDRRSDVFSLGVLLWELSTMRRLFKGVNRADTAMRVANAEVPAPSSVRPDYPVALQEIVMRALARDPEGRFASALRLDIELERFARRHALANTARTLATWVAHVHAKAASAAAPTDEGGMA